jgi:PmbA protein
VEKGQIAYPVQEITVAGQLRDVYRNLRAVADDGERPRAVEVGSMLIDGMMIAGA